MKQLKNICPEALLWLLMGSWWVVNLLQAGLTELSNDEAYYYLFSLRPAWGYFDHPPVTAWLVWLGRQIFGDSAFGIRFFFTVLQPLYLMILWRIIRPAEPVRRDVWLYFVVCAGLPILQLYGFVAVPDGPLLLGAALFLLCYKWFTERDDVASALLLGASVAFLAYCKYHGALIVLLAVAANIKLLKNWKIYLAAVVAAGLMLPHLSWQADHDWVSFSYHLSGRNKPFELSYITEYLLNMLAVFNPLFWPLYVKAWRKLKAKSMIERAIYCICAGFLVFFLFSSIRGHVQPQWVIVSVFGLLLLLSDYLRTHPRSYRYALRAGWVTILLFVGVRAVMAFTPAGTKFGIYKNEASYQAIASEAAGRPIIFGGNYAIPAKYIYYTGGEAYCQPNITYRSSQWQFIDADTPMAGREVLVEVRGDDAVQADTTLMLANGKTFAYTVVQDFLPVRKIEVEVLDDIPQTVSPENRIRLHIKIVNPYDYLIDIEPGTHNELVLIWGIAKKRQYDEYVIPEADFVLPAKASVEFEFTAPVPAAKGDYTMGFAVRNPPLKHWFAGQTYKIKVE